MSAVVYCISDIITQLERCFELGVHLGQYRNKASQTLLTQIKTKYTSKLVVNDSLEHAEQLSAFSVHLGQEDLDRYSLERIAQRKVGLGISTHSDNEIERALRYNPNYIAFGPIFEPISKKVAFEQQGLERLKQVVDKLDLPVIAIGGIALENLKEVLETGVTGVASISGLQKSSDKEIQEWLKIASAFEPKQNFE